MFRPAITKEDILKQRSQEEIFSFYGCPLNQSMFCSPLRQDRNPTCTLKWIGDRLNYRDWAESKPLDCFGFVMEKFGMDFQQALEKIYFDLDLKVEGNYNSQPIDNIQPAKSEKAVIDVTEQEFDKIDIAFLRQYGITKELCDKYKVFSVRNVKINGYYSYTRTYRDPCLGYYFGRDDRGNPKYKLYFYRREQKKFICNTNRIQGWVQIPQEGNLLVITKSLKDVMVLDKLNYNAIAPQAESFQFYDYIIGNLKERFNHIITLYDNDETGIKYAKEMEQRFNIPAVFVKETKDVSDLIAKVGVRETKTRINKLLHVT